MKRAFLLIAVLLIFQNIHAQKYIKYIFFNNHIKIVIPVSMKELDTEHSIVSKEENKDIRILKEWSDKNAGLICYLSSGEGNESLETLYNRYLVQQPGKYEEYTGISQQIKKIKRIHVAICEFTATNQHGENRYFLHFFFLYENDVIYFEFSCSEKKMDKYKPVFWEILESLNVT